MSFELSACDLFSSNDHPCAGRVRRPFVAKSAGAVLGIALSITEDDPPDTKASLTLDNISVKRLS